jgi:16S rRNA (cytosine1402-N4)-methyltransferase
MLHETVDLLAVKPDGVYIDCTLGGGGHSEELLKKLNEKGRLISIDRDTAAIARCQELFKGYPGRADLVHGNFEDMAEIARAQGAEQVDGIMMDLGFSSFQVDEAERGFSFMQDGPLDMRMDLTQPFSAADLVNTADEADLANVIFKYGEERMSRRIAKAIVEARNEKPFTTTGELALVIERVKPRKGRQHPATKTFQALRMEVNREMECLENGLAGALEILRPGGRLAVITFHSLEDRYVKQVFKRHRVRTESLQQGGVREIFEAPPVDWVNRNAVVASAAELEKNPRARSAKLRVVEVRKM